MNQKMRHFCLPLKFTSKKRHLIPKLGDMIVKPVIKFKLYLVHEIYVMKIFSLAQVEALLWSYCWQKTDYPEKKNHQPGLATTNYLVCRRRTVVRGQGVNL